MKREEVSIYIYIYRPPYVIHLGVTIVTTTTWHAKCVTTWLTPVSQAPKKRHWTWEREERLTAHGLWPHPFMVWVVVSVASRPYGSMTIMYVVKQSSLWYTCLYSEESCLLWALMGYDGVVMHEMCSDRWVMIDLWYMYIINNNNSVLPFIWYLCIYHEGQFHT